MKLVVEILFVCLLGLVANIVFIKCDFGSVLNCRQFVNIHSGVAFIVRFAPHFIPPNKHEGLIKTKKPSLRGFGSFQIDWEFRVRPLIVYLQREPCVDKSLMPNSAGFQGKIKA